MSSGQDDGLLVDVLGWRRLDEDAVDGRIVVELSDHGEKFRLGGFRREFQLDRVHTDLLAHAVLGANVGAGGWIVAHEHHRQTGRETTGFQLRDLGGTFGKDGVGDGDAVNNLGHG